MAKQVTRDQAERKKAQAAAFMERLGQPDRADEFREMSTDEYAEHKRLQLSNPRGRYQMAQVAGTKSVLQDQIDDAIEILDEAYAPETTREDLAEAVGRALDVLRGEDEDDDSDADADDEEYEYSPGD